MKVAIGTLVSIKFYEENEVFLLINTNKKDPLPINLRYLCRNNPKIAGKFAIIMFTQFVYLHDIMFNTVFFSILA